MPTLRTAVAVSTTEGTRRMLPGLLASAEVNLLHMDADGISALNSLTSLRPDLLVSDIELPRLDGISLTYQAICTPLLPVRPVILLLRWPEFFSLRQAEMEARGVVFLEKPLKGPAFVDAVHRLRESPVIFAPEDVAKVDALLDELGIPAHAGRECLKFSVLICACDDNARQALNRNVFRRASELCGLSSVQAARAMRYVIDRAWQSDKSDKYENQDRIFADAMNAARGQPTCNEMISRLADILRSEG